MRRFGTTKHSTKHSRSRGAVAIEFGLVLLPLMLVLLGTMDYGWYFFCQLSVTNAAREGARAGTTAPNCDFAKASAAVTSYLSAAGLGSQSTSVNATAANPTPSVQVSVTMTYSKLIGFVPLPATATATAVMLCP